MSDFLQHVFRQLKAGQLPKQEAVRLLQLRQAAQQASAGWLHPLLHRRQAGADGALETTLDGTEFFVADHVVHGQAIVPGVACLEMARAAFAVAANAGADAGQTLCLRNVVWARPLGFDAGPLQLQLALQATGAGGWSFEIRSRRAAPQAPWVHSQGLALPMAAQPRPSHDMAALLARCEGPVLDSATVYARYRAVGLEYGASLRAVQALHQGPGLVLARLALPLEAAARGTAFVLHPSLMDGALQASVNFLLGPEAHAYVPGRALPVPYALDELQLHAPCVEHMWAVLRRHAGASGRLDKLDIDLCDEQGTVCVRLLGFSSRTLGRTGDAGPADEDIGTVLLAPTLQAQALPAGAAAWPGRRCCLALGLPPAVAAELGARLPALSWLPLPRSADDVASQFGAAVQGLLAALREGPWAGGTPALLQVLVPAGGPAQLLAGLSGLLKVAGQELPHLTTQLLCSDSLQDAALLAAQLQAEALHLPAGEVHHRGGERLLPQWQAVHSEVPAQEPWHAGGVVLVSGGAGGLGQIFARQMLQAAAPCTVLLLGRAAPGERTDAQLHALRAQGLQVDYRACDVADATALQACVTDIQARHGAVRGVLHCAGSHQDSLIAHKRPEDVAAVLSSKVDGTLNLDAATAGCALDFFIVFASRSGVDGNVGQADYAAANAFLDRFAGWRSGLVQQGQRMGHTLSLDWPLWAEGGMQVDTRVQDLRRESTGMEPLPTASGLAALRQAWHSRHSQVLVLHGQRQRLLQRLQQATPQLPSAQAAAQPAAVVAAPAAQGGLREAAIQYFKQLVSGVLKLPAQRIDAEAGMDRYGIDSIMVMRLTNQLETVFGSLPKTLFFEYQTLAELSEHFLRTHAEKMASLLGPQAAPAAAAAPHPAPPAPPPEPQARPAAAPAEAAPSSQDIAIIGMAGRFPQANDLDAFWDNLRQGRDCITEIPPERWDHAALYDADKSKPGKAYSKWGGFIDGVDEFDPLFFNVAPRHAEAMDPQSRLFLQCAYATLEDAGYTRDSLARHRELGLEGNVAVYVGVMYEEYQLYGAQSQALGDAPYAVSGSASSIANRVSYFFNFHGPSMAVDTMCSASLTALHLACECLQRGGAELALAGGVNVSIHPNKYLYLSQGKFVSSKGLCESFGEGGEGYVPAEGVGAVLLKPLAHALRDGDRIHGIIKATAINHGGRTNGYTVPNPAAQGNVIGQALARAGVHPRMLGYIEAHGTGTSLGDPIEIAGLARAFQSHTTERQFCAIGSVKSNIGHAESAAGMAGLAKVLLQMRHGQLAPSLHSAQLNPHIDFAASPFVVQQELADWKRPLVQVDGRMQPGPRMAGISSFGAGGSNAHVVVAEHLAAGAPAPSPPVTADRPGVFLLSARNPERLQAQVQRLLAVVQARRPDASELADMAYTLQVGREAMEERAGVLAATSEMLEHGLQALLQGEKGAAGVWRGRVPRDGEPPGAYADDEDLDQTLAAWMAKGKYGKLLELWVQGLAVDWHQLYGAHKPRRVGLPSYPFARERYWVPLPQGQRAVAAATLHPLLHTNSSDLAGLRFSSRFTGEEPFLRDHVVGGRRLLPGVAQLEMACAGAAHASGLGLERGRRRGVRLSQVVWVRPIVVEPGQPVQVHLAVTSREDGRIDWEIFTLQESAGQGGMAGQGDTAGQEQLHSQGVAEVEELASAGQELAKLDLQALQAQCPRTLGPAEVYERLQARGLQYGPAHRAIHSLHVGEQQALALLQLPAQQALPGHDLHPSLLDGALQACLGLSLELPAGQTLLPYAVEQVDVLAPCQARMWAHVRRSAASGPASDKLRKLDIELCDDDGGVCVRLQGYSARLAEGAQAQAQEQEQEQAQEQAPAQTLLLHPQWQAGEDRPAGAAPAQHEVLLCGLTHIQPQALQSALQTSAAAVRVQQLPGLDEAHPEADYTQRAIQLLQHLQQLLQARPGGTVLLQVLIGGQASQPLLAGLAGLLKSATQENPRLQGQLIAIDTALGPAELAQALHHDSRRPWEQHIRHQAQGRVQLQWQELAPQPQAAPIWKPQGVYLITGGAGGLGRIFAHEILQCQPQARVVLTGRGRRDADKQALLQSLNQGGTERASYSQLDVSDPHAVAGLIDAIVQRHGRLDGIVHSAGVNRDGFLVKKTAAQLQEVLAPKVAGLVNLDRASAGLALDCVILFSSKAGSQGNLGQADYAAANAFMDSYAGWRNGLQAQGQRQGRTLTLNWPLWAEGGMRMDAATQAAKAQASGTQPLPTPAGIQALYQAWASGQQQVLVLHGQRDKLLQALQQAPQAPQTPQTPAAVQPEAKTEAAPQAGLQEQTERHLKRLLSGVLKLPAQRIDAQAALEVYGIDSVMVMQLSAELEKSFGALSKTLFFEYQNLQSLAAYFVREHRAALAVLLGPQGSPQAPVQQAAAQAVALAPRGRRRGLAAPAPAALRSERIDIAIIGLSGRYPQARDLQQYWDNLKAGRNCVTEIPAERWDHGLYYDADKSQPGKTYSKWGGFIDGVDRFDPLFFGISPREAERRDPQERLFLQCAHEALEDAGYTRAQLGTHTEDGLQGGSVGVYVGVMYEEYQLYGAQETAMGRPMALGGLASSVANRVSYWCNFHGPSIALDTMCSSSLTALHLACEALRRGQCSVALAGGVNVSVHPNKYLLLGQGKFVSSKGLCESFGEGGEGYVPAEGVGAVLLKPLAQAEADGDHIYGVIKGSAINHGGKTNGFSVPNPQAQAAVVEQALKEAGVHPRAISYIEAHGTGTSLGDPIEIAGLAKAFGKQTQDRQYCAIGSAKSNIGHAESAAGIAGLSKVLLQMKHGQLVPSLHSQTLNPHIDFAASPFVVQQELAEWKRPVLDLDGQQREYPRIAGLSSFGAGGSNAHVVIQEYIPSRARQAAAQPSAAQPALVVLSAKNEERLQEQVQRLLQAIEAQPQLELADLAYTLQVGREAMEERLAVLAGSLQELHDKLQAHQQGRKDVQDLYRGQARRGKDTLGVFQGDEDLAGIVQTWVTKGKHGKLLELWVQGLALDWSQLHGTPAPRRISLPTYPFAQDRCWFEPEGARPGPGQVMQAAAVLHPLLHANDSDFEQQCYSSRFTGEEPFLRDHVVGGRRLLPGVAQLEMACAGAAHASGLGLERGRRRGVRLSQVVWVRPIVVEPGQPVQVHLALTSREDGRIDWEIFTLQETSGQGEVAGQGGMAGQGDTAGQEQLHSQGVAEVEELASAGQELAKLDLQALQAQCPRTLGPAEVYERLQARGLQYGPAHRAIHSLHVGEQQALALLQLPAQQALPGHDLHPSLLDGALQACLGLSLELPAGQTLLPYAVEQVDVLAPCQARMWAHVRRSAASGPASDKLRKLDIELCDDDGGVCVRLQGYSARLAEGAQAQAQEQEQEQAQEQAPAQTLLLHPQWQAGEDRPAGAAPAQHEVLLCGLTHIQPQALQSALQTSAAAVRVQQLPGLDEAHPEADYTQRAIQLLQHLQQLLQARPGGTVLLQVLIGGQASQPLLAGLAGLLKSATQENPRLQGQLIAIDTALGPAELAQALHHDSRRPWEQHIRHQAQGRVQLQWQELAPQPQAAPIWKPQGVYLITGGAGGLGRIFAHEILQCQPQARVVLTGRGRRDADKQALLQSLNQGGTERASYSQLDVSDPHAVAGLIDAIVQRHGRLDGIVHSAGVNRDGFLVKKTAAQLQEVLAPKVAGLVNLDRASAGLALDCVILFSSKAGSQGNLGQADYAAANAFMDSYAGWRNGLQAQGQRQGRTLTLNWPLWAEGGMRMDAATQAAKAQASGTQPLPTPAGIQALYQAWASGQQQVLVLHGQRDKLLQALQQAPQAPQAPQTPQTPAAAQPEAKTEAAPQAGLQEQTERHLKRLLSGVLKLPAQRIDAQAALEVYGIDSVMVMQLSAELEKSFGALSKTLFFEYQNLQSLAAYFVREHRAALAVLLGPQGSPQAPVQQAAAQAVALAPRGRRRGLAAPAPAALRSERIDIAIIGLSGRYPQARDLQQYWDNLKAGRNCVTEIPAERWDHGLYYDADKSQPGKTYSKWGGFIDGVDRFDPLFFGISPREAERRDPQERLFLQCAHEALEDAGYTRAQLGTHTEDGLQGGSVGVYVGVMYEEYQLYGAQETAMGRPMALGGLASSVANRVSYWCNFHGPSIALDTMCSSSLTALHLACEALRRGQCTVALAGGVNVSVHPNKYLLLGQGKFVSSKGLCESFGEGGEGYVPAEGVGAVLLKPLAQAEADGDHIYGVIKGSAINHGGKTNGFSVPNPQAQAAVVEQALKEAGVHPRAISYIEAHGTGTSLGDPIEIAGLAKAFGKQTQDRQYCAIGSAKSNIGHAESAAGIAGLSKVLLQMKHGQLVPSLHSQTLNPHIDFAASPFVVQQELAEWKRPVLDLDGQQREYPRIAGLSAFGAGGSNAHVIVQEYLPTPARSTVDCTPERPALVLLSARSDERLQEQVQRLLQAIERQPQLELAELAYTLQTGREAMDERLAIMATSLQQLQHRLQAVAQGQVDGDGVFRGSLKRNKDRQALLADEEMARVVDAWVDQARWGQLLTLWVQGLAFDWQRLYPGDKPRRVSLPTYPFAQDRYWITPGPMTAPTSVPQQPARSLVLASRDWVGAPATPGRPASRRVLLLSHAGAKALEQQLLVRWPDALVLHGDDASAQPLGEFDTVIDILGTVAGEHPLHGWPLALQGWVEQRRQLGGMALGVSAGLQGDASQGSGIAGATRAGLYRMLQSEYGRIRSRHLDLDPSEPMDAWVAQLLRELDTDDSAVALRYRGGERQAAGLRSTPITELAGDRMPAFPAEQVLWVSGGTRGIGALCAAHFVARHGVRKLVLTGREVFPPREQWAQVQHEDSAMAAKLRAVLAMEAAGAQVHVLSPLPDDAQGLHDRVAEVLTSMGPIGGVLHAAGVFDAATPAFIHKTADGLSRVMAPKTRDLDLLLHAVEEQPLRFFVLFSSVSAVLPALAAGQIDYAAANASMDSRAVTAPRGLPLISVQWPSWGDSGMGKARSQAYRDTGLLHLSDAEGLALLDHVIATRPGPVVLPAVVDTAVWPSWSILQHARTAAAVTPPQPREPRTAAVQVPQAVAPSEVTGRLQRTRQWLTGLFVQALKIDPAEFETDQDFIDYGADSVLLSVVLGSVGKALGRAMDPAVLFQHTHVDALASWLMDTHADSVQRLFPDEAAPAALTAATEALPALLPTQAAVAVPAVAAPVDPEPPREPLVPTAVQTGATGGGQDLAVVGMACRFPGAPDLQAYWDLLREGRSAIAPVPVERWGYDTGQSAGLLADSEGFDAEHFKISLADARAMDPQARLLLELGVQLMHHAGLGSRELRGQAVGVYLGARSRHRPEEQLLQAASHPVMASGQNYLAANLSQHFDLRGPSLVVDTACSSALVAMKLAMQSLLAGDVSAAMVGGVNLLDTDGALRMFQQRKLLQREFHIFDRRAAGVVLGEGAGLVLLKTLAQAQRDGDSVLAVIKALEVNNDGRTASPVAPNLATQKLVMQRALLRSGLQARDIGHIEVNGSGSEVTDLLELKALQAVYGGSGPACSLGSVKPNIGHPLCAEGIAGFIKLVLMLSRRVWVPFLSAQQPAAHFDIEAAGFCFRRAATPWEAAVRRAAISSFGDGGTNAHAVLESAAAALAAGRPSLPMPQFNRVPMQPGADAARGERALWDFVSAADRLEPSLAPDTALWAW